MTTAGFDADSYIEAVAPALGLIIPAARRPAVAMFLALAADMAALVASVPLTDEACAGAPVFTPGARGAE